MCQVYKRMLALLVCNLCSKLLIDVGNLIFLSLLHDLWLTVVLIFASVIPRKTKGVAPVTHSD